MCGKGDSTKLSFRDILEWMIFRLPRPQATHIDGFFSSAFLKWEVLKIDCCTDGAGLKDVFATPQKAVETISQPRDRAAVALKAKIGAKTH